MDLQLNLDSTTYYLCEIGQSLNLCQPQLWHLKCGVIISLTKQSLWELNMVMYVNLEHNVWHTVPNKWYFSLFSLLLFLPFILLLYLVCLIHICILILIPDIFWLFAVVCDVSSTRNAQTFISVCFIVYYPLWWLPLRYFSLQRMGSLIQPWEFPVFCRDWLRELYMANKM